MTNLIFIIDPNEAYLRNKTQEIYKSWGYERSEVKEMKTWEPVPKGTTLFGDKLMTHLDLSDAKDLKAFADTISHKSTKDIFTGDWYGNATIITAKKAQGSKKIENLVEKSGGQVQKGNKKTNRKADMLKELNLQTQVKSAISDYIGEDYDLMLSFYNEVSEMKKADQKKLTLDEAFSLIPPSPGSVLPWEYLNYLINGNTTKAISMFERTVEKTHCLVPLTFLTRKMSTLYRVRMAMEDGINSNSAIGKAIGETNTYEIKILMGVAKKLSIRDVELIALFTTELESDIKGGSKIDDNILFKTAIAKIGILLGNKH